MLFTCSDCAKKMSLFESMNYVSGLADGGFCSKGQHFYCQNPKCCRALEAGSRQEDPKANEAWFPCAHCGSRNYFASNAKGEPTVITRTTL